MRLSSKALLRFFGDTPLDRITPEDVEKFKTKRGKQRKRAPGKPAATPGKNPRPLSVKLVKPATVNRELACLKALCNYFIKDDVLAKNPVSRVKFYAESQDHMRVLSSEEERLYLLAASQPLQDVATLMIETGARPEEICRLQCSNINLMHGYFRIPFGKTKAARRKVPLSLRAQDRRTALDGSTGRLSICGRARRRQN